MILGKFSRRPDLDDAHPQNLIDLKTKIMARHNQNLEVPFQNSYETMRIMQKELMFQGTHDVVS